MFAFVHWRSRVKVASGGAVHFHGIEFWIALQSTMTCNRYEEKKRVKNASRKIKRTNKYRVVEWKQMKLNFKKAKNCRLFTLFSPENVNIDEWNGWFAKDFSLSPVASLDLLSRLSCSLMIASLMTREQIAIRVKWPRGRTRVSLAKKSFYSWNTFHDHFRDPTVRQTRLVDQRLMFKSGK